MRLVDCKDAEGEIVNIGGVEEISIADLARRVLAATKSASPIQLVPYSVVYPKDFEDMLRRVPSIDKLAALTGYRPTTSLDTILTRVVEYQRKNPENL